MAKGVLDKFLNFIGFEDTGLDEGEMPEGEVPDSNNIVPRGRKAAVVNLHTQMQGKVVLIEPLSFDEVQSIVDQLKNHKSIIVNVETIEKELAKRMVDFLSGATYALGGNMQKVSSGIFLFVPSNIEITGSMRDEINERMNERAAEKITERNLLFWKNK
ncbi:MAG: cell division protein SepF [bacterium]